jgi:glycosyl transferase family 25
MASMPPVWVVSLERAPERRSFVVQSFADTGLVYEIVDAVDGTTLSSDELRSYSRARSLFEVGRGLMEGEVGCALSHLRLLQRMLDEGLPEVLIVEDDVAPMPALARLLERRDRLPADRDVVTFCSLWDTAAPRPVAGVDLDDEHGVCTYRRMLFGAQCYLITAAAARRVLDVAYPIRMPYDELLFRRRPANLRVYGVEPRVVRLEPFASELVARSAAPGKVTAGARLTSWPLSVAGKVHRRLLGRAAPSDRSGTQQPPRSGTQRPPRSGTQPSDTLPHSG